MEFLSEIDREGEGETGIGREGREEKDFCKLEGL